MRMTQFWEFVSLEFGESYGRVLVDDLSLERFSGATAREVLETDVDPRDVWMALCESTDVPRSRWHGREKQPHVTLAVDSPAPWPRDWPH